MSDLEQYANDIEPLFRSKKDGKTYATREEALAHCAVLSDGERIETFAKKYQEKLGRKDRFAGTIKRGIAAWEQYKLTDEISADDSEDEGEDGEEEPDGGAYGSVA